MLKNPILVIFSTIILILLGVTIYFVVNNGQKSNLNPEVVSGETSTPLVSSTTEAEKPVITENGSLQVYFLDQNHFNTGLEPYEQGVNRIFSTNIDLKQAVINELYKGPSLEEKYQGLSLVTSGTTGATVSFKDGVAVVTLHGPCSSGGSTYTVANLITKNLQQFPDVSRVTFRVETDKDNISATSTSDLPVCLEP